MAPRQWAKFLPSMFQEPPKSLPMFAPTHLYDDKVGEAKKNLLKPYPAPVGGGDMFVIVPFFNPCNSVRIVQNIMLMTAKLEASSIPYCVIHALFPDSVALRPECSETYVTVKTGSFAFLKENLANIVIKLKKDKYNKFCLLDSDIIFSNEQWYDMTARALDRADVVQPFTAYVNLGSDFVTELASGPGNLAAHKAAMSERGNIEGYIPGHPGYSIAFNVGFLEKLGGRGIPDLNILGGGDTMICSLTLQKKVYANHWGQEYYDYIYDKYKAQETVTWDVVDGVAMHLYHGDIGQRQYVTRYAIFAKYLGGESPYCVITDIVYKNKDGVYEWIDEIRESINAEVLNYFASRCDDA